MNQYSITKHFTAALCLSCAVAVVTSHDLRDEYVPRRTNAINQQSSRSFLRRRVNNDVRQLQTDDWMDDDDIQIVFGPEPALTRQSPCKSIIAVGGWRLLASSNNTVSSTIGDFSRDHMNTVLSYEDEEELDTEEEFVCEFYDGSTLPIEGTEEQIVEMRRLLNDGTLISAETTVEVEPNIGLDGFMSTSDTISLPPGLVKVINSDNGSEKHSRRLTNNNMYKGTKKILVVRVTDGAGKSVEGDAHYVSDKFFGTYGDKVTMKSGFEACSFGKFNVSNDYENEDIRKRLSAPGVLDVRIDVRLDDSTQSVITAAVKEAVKKKLGMSSLPGPFDHIAFVLEACYEVGTDCAFAAYAFTKHWLSVFVDENYKYPTVVMHELGHNLNLAHSGGTDGQTYTDPTCLMGDPLWEDDVGKMCFNPVKNYQIAASSQSWYDNRHTAYFNSGTTGGTSWSGKIIGVFEYGNNPSNHPIVLKIESGGSSDWFIGFNRAFGINADNVQAHNKVTIYKVKAGDGKGYSQSFFKGTLREGRSATIANWRQTGLNLVINVNKIDTHVSPGYADVEIAFGPPTPNPTPIPTMRLSRRPTGSPSKRPTDQPTSSPSNEPTNEPTRSPTEEPTEKPTMRPTAWPTSGPTRSPSKKPTDNPTRLPTAKPTEKPADQPTSSPSNEPTNEPTRSPTEDLTEKPTMRPTAWPTSGPTRSPSKKPTDNPTRLPTSKPTGKPTDQPTSSPSNEPTNEPTRSSTEDLTEKPTTRPTALPTSGSPSKKPTDAPIPGPTVPPTKSPTQLPTTKPTHSPSNKPTNEPTRSPIKTPTEKPTKLPTWQPTKDPSPSPTVPPSQPPTHPPTMGDIVNFNSGTTGGTSWSGKIIGAAHYGNNPSVHPIIIVLVSADTSDWFIGLNDIQVTISKVEDGWISLMGALIAGQSETISNWRNSGLDLVVMVNEINNNASPVYADVEITFGPHATPTSTPILVVPTGSPRKKHTNNPTRLPTSKPTETPTPGPTVLLTQSPTQLPTVGDIVNFNSGTQGGTSWSGKIIGAAHYGNNPSNNPIIIKLVSGDTSDWFIYLSGIHVTITKVKDGQISLMGTLPAGTSMSISNWRKSSFDLMIKVNEIDTDVTPSYASVEITFGPEN